MSAHELSGMGTSSRGKRCPHCNSTRTWLTWMRWANGLQVEFWSCDACKRTFDRHEERAPEPAHE